MAKSSSSSSGTKAQRSSGALGYSFARAYFVFDITFGGYFLSGTEKYIYNAFMFFALAVIVRYFFSFCVQLAKFIMS